MVDNGTSYALAHEGVSLNPGTKLLVPAGGAGKIVFNNCVLRLNPNTMATVPANGLPASIAPAMQAVVGTGGRVDLWKRVRPEIGLSASSCKMLAVVGQFGIFG